MKVEQVEVCVPLQFKKVRRKELERKNPRVDEITTIISIPSNRI